MANWRPVLFFLFLFFQASMLGNAFYPISGNVLPYAEAKIGSQVTGKIQEKKVDAGQCVQEGEVLLRLDPAFFEFEFQKRQLQIKLAELAYENACRYFNRKKSLWERDDNRMPSISRQEFEESELVMQQALLVLQQNRLDLETARLQKEETEIKSPYQGIVTKVYGNVGDSAIAYAPLFEIMDISKVWLEFYLPQELQEKIRVGQDILLENQLQGKVEKIFPNVDARHRCFACRVLFENTQGTLKPGMFVTGKLFLEENRD